MVLEIFTLFHVLISLVGIGTGFVVMYGMLESKRLDGWTMVFLATTVATSATGFLFPFHHLLPSHILGVLSLIVLGFAIPARYQFHMASGWRYVYVVGAAMALYLNVFVAVVQAFLKIPALHGLAPTQKEPPFAIVQTIVLLLFVAATYFAVRRFHVEQASAANRRSAAA